MKHLKLFEQFMEGETFYIHVKWRGKDTLISVAKYGNKWMENHESGPQLPQFGMNHIGMSIDAVVSSLNNRYDSAELVSEEEALELI